MKRFVILFFVLLFFSSANITHASLVVVEPDGNVVVDVLGASDEVKLEIPKNEALEVKESLAYKSDGKSLISLKKNSEGVVLSVTGSQGEKTLEVTDYKDEVIEIEERPKSAKLSILVADNKFNIRQGALIASTDYEITVDPAKARVLLDTPSGQRVLSINPSEATQTLLRAKTLSDFNSKTGISIVENDSHELTYKIDGKKLLNFFNFYYHPVEITAYVSALTGEIISVDQPQWLSVLGFLFA